MQNMPLGASHSRGVLLTVHNIDSVDPTSLTGEELERYHHLKRYKQMMDRANDAQMKHNAYEQAREKREREREQRERLQSQTAEGVRLARQAIGDLPAASVTLAFRRGGAATSTSIFARWSSDWRAEQKQRQQALRRRAKMKRWKLDAEESVQAAAARRAEEECTMQAQLVKQEEAAKRRALAARQEANRKNRARFLKHKPGNPHAVWELQQGLSSDRKQGWVGVTDNLNKNMELAFVRENRVFKFTVQGQLCIAHFERMEVENTISQRFTPLRRRLRNGKRLEREREEADAMEAAKARLLAQSLPRVQSDGGTTRPISAIAPVLSRPIDLLSNATSGNTRATTATPLRPLVDVGSTQSQVAEWEVCLSEGEWVRYPASVAKLLERAFSRRTHSENTVQVYFSSSRTEGKMAGFTICLDDPMHEVHEDGSKGLPVRRREPLRPAAMIKSAYPTFEDKHKGNKLQLLSVSDRWAAGHFGSLHEAVYAACLEGDQVALRKMHATGQVFLDHKRDVDGRGFLHALAYASSESIWEKRYFADMCRLLLEWKAFPELRDGHGQTAVYIAATNGNETVLAALLEAKADSHSIKAPPGGQSALIAASVKGVRNCVRLLIGACADLEYAPSSDLIQNVGIPHLEVGPSAEAGRRQQFASGGTALWFAARAGQLQSVRELIEGKANLNTRSANGRSPLQVAIHGGHVAVAKELVEAGAAAERVLGGTLAGIATIQAPRHDSSPVQQMLLVSSHEATNLPPITVRSPDDYSFPRGNADAKHSLQKTMSAP